METRIRPPNFAIYATRNGPAMDVDRAFVWWSWDWVTSSWSWIAAIHPNWFKACATVLTLVWAWQVTRSLTSDTDRGAQSSPSAVGDPCVNPGCVRCQNYRRLSGALAASFDTFQRQAGPESAAELRTIAEAVIGGASI